MKSNSKVKVKDKKEPVIQLVSDDEQNNKILKKKQQSQTDPTLNMSQKKNKQAEKSTQVETCEIQKGKDDENQFTNSRNLSIDTENSRKSRKKGNDNKLQSTFSKETKQLLPADIYHMPMEIQRTSVKYDHLTWKWLANKTQLQITRFKGTKSHLIPAFLDFAIPPRGKHILRMKITRSKDYRIYFGITVKRAIYDHWTNVIPAPFIAFSYEQCCIFQKPFKQNQIMRQILPSFNKVYDHIEMAVDMQNHIITFTMKKKNKVKEMVYQMCRSFINQAIESEKQSNIKKKMHGLIPFVGFMTDFDRVKFLSEE